jgi:hypothetical protein
MRWVIPWLVTLCALLCLGMVAIGFTHRGEEIKALQARVEELAKSADQAKELQTKLVAAEKARNTAEKSVRAQKAEAQQSSSPRAVGQPMNLMSKMRTDPEYAPIWRKQQLRGIQQQFGDTFAAMKLPPEELAKLRELLVARNDAVMDANEAAQQAGLSPRETGMAVSQAQNEVNDEIKALIGTDGFQQLQQPSGMYKKMIENSVGVDLAMAGAPLTPDQTTLLAQAYSTPVQLQGLSRDMHVTDPQTGLSPYYQALLDRMTPNLSPAQIPVVKNYFIEQTQQQQYMMKQMAANRAQ